MSGAVAGAKIEAEKRKRKRLLKTRATPEMRAKKRFRRRATTRQKGQEKDEI